MQEVGSVRQIDASIERYLGQIASADRQERDVAKDKVQRLEDKIAALKQEMARLKRLEVQMFQAPEQQISLTDPDSRSMKSRDGGIVGYNVQRAVDAKHHLIVAHEVTNVGLDREQLANMAKQAKEMVGSEQLEVVADRGYFKSQELLGL